MPLEVVQGVQGLGSFHVGKVENEESALSPGRARTEDGKVSARLAIEHVQAVSTLRSDAAAALKRDSPAAKGARHMLRDIRANSEKEHVVGRRFVPRGSLARSWNLIVRSCSQCNADKGDLEDEISAVAMQPDALGRYPTEGSLYREEAKRKGRGARHRGTGRPVENSRASLDFESGAGPIRLTTSVVGPPPIDETRVLQLCSFHLRGFGYYLNRKRCRGNVVERAAPPLASSIGEAL